MGVRGPLAGGERAAQGEAAGAAGLVAPQPGFEQPRGGGIFPLPAADAPAHFLHVGLRVRLQGGIEGGELAGERFHLPREQGGFLVRARRAAAKHELLEAAPVGVREQLGFASALDFTPAFLFQKRRLELPKLALGRADQIARAACAQELDVLRADHAAVHDPDAPRHSVFFLHRAHDLLDGGHVAAIAGEDLVGKRQALRRADHAEADLFAVGARIARVTARGLFVSLGLAFEKGARHIVKQELELHAEPRAIALHEMRAEPFLVRREHVEAALEPVIVDLFPRDPEQIGERAALITSARRQPAHCAARKSGRR